MKLVKDMLKPGVYNERGRVLQVTKQDIDQIHDSVKMLHDSGYKIPVWLEHVPVTDRKSFPIKSSDQQLLSQAEGDPWFGGWITGINRDSQDMLHSEIEVPDHLGTRLAEVGTFVSPQFGEWDEIKDKTSMALLHLALTRNPVNRDQSKNFSMVPEGKNSGSALDTTGTSGQTADHTRPLGLVEAMQTGIKSFSFSLGDAVNFQPSAAAGAAGQSQQGAVQTNQPQSMPGQQTDPAADLKSKLQQALQALGITLDPNSAILQNADLMTRVLSTIANAEGDAISQLKNQAPDSGLSGGRDPYTEQSTVVAMSQTSTTNQTPAPVAPATPVVNPLETTVKEQGEKIHQLSQTLVNQDNVNKGLMALLTNGRRKEYDSRIDKLVSSGRCTAENGTALKALSNVYQFSLSQDPTAKGEIDLKLEVYESLPEGACWDVNTRLAQGNISTHQFSNNLSPLAAPSGEVTPERAEEIMAEYNRIGQMGFYSQPSQNGAALNRQ